MQLQNIPQESGPKVTLTATASSTTPFSIRQRAQAKNPNFISLATQFLLLLNPQLIQITQQRALSFSLNNNTIRQAQTHSSLNNPPLSPSKLKARIFLQEWSWVSSQREGSPRTQAGGSWVFELGTSRLPNCLRKSPFCLQSFFLFLFLSKPNTFYFTFNYYLINFSQKISCSISL